MHPNTDWPQPRPRPEERSLEQQRSATDAAVDRVVGLGDSAAVGVVSDEEEETVRRPSLLAVSRVPPWLATHGAALRIRALLEELARRWDVTLVFGQGSDHEAGEVTAPVVAAHAVSLNVAEEEADRRTIVPLEAAVQRLVETEQFDVALLWSGTEFLANEPWFPLVAVCDKIDSEMLAARRRQRTADSAGAWLREMRDMLSWARYEWLTSRAAAAVVVVGADDARAITLLTGGRRPVHVIPNGVRMDDSFDPESEGPIPTVVFTGTLDFPPNVEAAEHFARVVWPTVLAAVPEARFVVAGRNPVESVRALAELEGVEVAADVEDMSAVLRASWLAVAPMLSGGGVKNKVLEAWASGKPVVMTTLATNGLRVDEGEGAVVVDDDLGMAREVVRLLRDADRRRRAGASARREVAEHHSWRALAAELSTVLNSARLDARSRR